MDRARLGTHRAVRARAPADCEIAPILGRCLSRLLTFDETHRTRQESFLEFGLRWRCLKAIHIGENEALAELELPAAVAADASDFRLHPAILDLATGAALYLIDGYGATSSFYFPMFYKPTISTVDFPRSFLATSERRKRSGSRCGNLRSHAPERPRAGARRN